MNAFDHPRFKCEFDPYGRCLPTDLPQAQAHAATRRYFQLAQPENHLGRIHARLARHLGLHMSEQEFGQKITALIERIAADGSSSGVLSGPYVPAALPKLSGRDIGQLLDTLFIPALTSAFTSEYPNSRFKRHGPQELSHTLSANPESRHGELIEHAQEAETVFIYFPCLSAYSISAARQQLQTMPQTWSLSGGIDTCAALIASPGLLRNETAYPPLLWFAALDAEAPTIGYHLEAYGRDLTFNRRAHNQQAVEYWWCALSVRFQ